MRADARVVVVAALALWLASCASGPSSPAAPGARVAHVKAGYTLEIPEEWKPPQEVDAADVDLSLERDGGSSWLLVRSASGNMLRLEDVVRGRRDAILASNQVSDYRERRSYHPSTRHIPMSLVRYQVDSIVVLTMTAVDGDYAVELVAGTALGIGRERELLELFDTLRFPEAEVR